MANKLITPEQAAQELSDLINAAAAELPEDQRAAFIKAAIESLQTTLGGFPPTKE